MSDCKKCDRCGEHYTKDINYRKLGKLYDTGGATKDQWDLCPDCWESFDSWIANDGSAPKNGVSDTEVDANDANAASVEGSAGAVFVDGVQVFPPKLLEDADAAPVPFSSVTEIENADSRAKLMEDANAIAIDYWHRKRTWGDANDLKRDVIALLDRQASITEREILSHPDERDEQIAELQQQVDELSERKCPGYDPTRHYCKYHAQDFGLNDRTVSRLKRENSALARDLAECERMRDGLRARLSEAIGKASEIAALGDL